RKKGHIINIGSTAGKEVYKDGNAYCASKHAVDAISKAMRIDLLLYRIKVTAIHPGAAETEFSIVRFKGDDTKADAVYDGYKALQAADIADIVDAYISKRRKRAQDNPPLDPFRDRHPSEIGSKETYSCRKVLFKHYHASYRALFLDHSINGATWPKNRTCADINFFQFLLVFSKLCWTFCRYVRYQQQPMRHVYAGATEHILRRG
ncbi:MAG: SDR family NAD(P)-dependent oxidoreductase, partial [Akkermansiaceae bacterium]|nr:SDR family NAD(P)-dependent oxidoreductase [Akkermansiaceae bacterium]